MKFGWKPEADKEIPPIPLCFGLTSYDIESLNNEKVVYEGVRYKNSYLLHEAYANKQIETPVTSENHQEK
jgi:hypothetical protein